MRPSPWPSIIEGLVQSGLTQPQIAHAADCGQSTISDLLRGKTCDPRTSVGLVLLKMAEDRIPGFVAPSVDYELPETCSA